MKKAELAKHIPKRIGEGSTKLLEVCGEPVLMVTGTRNPSYAGMPNKAAHFTWSKGYLTAWIGNDKSLTWTNEGLGWISITNGEKKKDYEAAAAFLNAMGYGHGLGTMWRYYDVENFEGQMSSQKRQRAMERKQNRINSFMQEQVPPLPEDFKDKIREMAKDVKPGKRMNVKMFQQAHDGVVERIFWYAKGPGGIGPRTYGYELKEDEEVLTEFCRAFTSTYGDVWDFWYYGEIMGLYGERQQFWDKKQIGDSNIPKKFRIYDNFKDENMTRQQESCLRIMDGLADPSIILDRLHFCPSLEYVIKSGWTRMAADLCSRSTGWCEEKLENIAKLDKNTQKRLARMNASLAAEELFEDNPKLTDENLAEISTWKSDYKVGRLKDIADMGLNLNHVMTLLRKTGGLKEQNMIFYRDYLDMARQRGGDIHDEIIYRNKRWREFHDRYVAEQERARAEEQKARMKAEGETKFKGIERDFDRNARIFGWNNGTSCILIPRTFEDIIEEGQKQHHCVGASDRYMLKMARRETWIVFLRHTENPEEPWYTIETDGRRVIQYYAAYDRQPDKEEVSGILEEWMKDVRKNKARVEKEEARKLKEAADKASQETALPLLETT